jgi:hypothetical protein
MSAPPTVTVRSSERAVDTIADRGFRLLLRAYPAPFRAAYGREMTLLFRDQRREAGASALFWAGVVWDMLGSAPQARVEAFRALRTGHAPDERGAMRLMWMLTVLAGTVDASNALIEAHAGWADRGNAAWLVSIAAVVLAGVLLAAAGIASLQRRPSSHALARLSAVVCLAVFAEGVFLPPWASVFTRLVGVGFPLLLLLVLRSPSARRPPAFAS